MSLNQVILTNTKSGRNTLLSNYLKKNSGLLNEEETNYFKIIFDLYYTPDNGEEKYNIDDIISVKIGKNKSYGGCCFYIFINDIWKPTSIKKLAGTIINNNLIITRALRFAINEQILDFIHKNPLDVTQICPLENKPIGYDAQVDHVIPFSVISEKWLENNTININNMRYDFNQNNYFIDSPFQEDWYNFHQDNAKLRWISKDGNKYAHKFK